MHVHTEAERERYVLVERGAAHVPYSIMPRKVFETCPALPVESKKRTYIYSHCDLKFWTYTHY